MMNNEYIFLGRGQVRPMAATKRTSVIGELPGSTIAYRIIFRLCIKTRTRIDTSNYCS